MINYHTYEYVENEHLYGPGKRLLLFCQGCLLRCKGCINSHLWEFGKGTDISTQEILDLCKDVEGITIHGGEPLQQSEGIFELIKALKNNGKSVILFTGYTFDELTLDSQKDAWNNSDIVVAGRYEEEKRNIYLQFRGSTNQEVIVHKGKYENYQIKDGETIALVSINENGEIETKGFQNKELTDLLQLMSC